MTHQKPKIGAHVSIAGGIQNAPVRAREEGCETFQCFTRSPQGGPAPQLTEELVSLFKKELKQNDIETFYIHAPYYINLASLDNRIRYASIHVIREELERGTALGARYIMFHVGSHNGQTSQEGILKVNKGINKILDGYAGTTGLLVEISAGAGDVLGDTFEEVGEMVQSAKNLPGFSGVCFDTCHAFASGYDFRVAENAKNVLGEFEKHVGLEWLKLTHVNDSKGPLGDRKDRHEHIGKGHIGQEGITNILTTKPFLSVDWILETEPVERHADVTTLKQMRG